MKLIHRNLDGLATAANDFLVGQGAGQVVKKTLVETKAILGVTGLGTYTVGDLLYASAVNTLSVLPDVAVGSVLVSGGVGAAPAWSATPSLTGITTTGVASLTTPAESWVGPSSTTGIYFKDGNVGIGTTGPGYKLDVAGSSRVIGSLIVQSNDAYFGDYAAGSYADIGNLGTGNAWFDAQGAAADVGVYIRSKGAGTINLYNGTTQALTAMNGNVGIGTTGPATKLDVAGGNIVVDYNNGLLSRDAGGTIYNMIRSNSSIAGVSIGDIVTNGTLLNLVSGNVGIGTTSPTNLLSLGGNAARIFWMERHTTANTAGNSLTVQAGGATSGATDKAGGDLLLKPGRSTGTGESGLQLQGCVAGGSGTGDNSFATILQILGNKLALFGATPVAQQLKANHNDWAAVSDVVSALVNLGLFDQN